MKQKTNKNVDRVNKDDYVNRSVKQLDKSTYLSKQNSFDSVTKQS